MLMAGACTGTCFGTCFGTTGESHPLLRRLEALGRRPGAGPMALADARGQLDYPGLARAVAALAAWLQARAATVVALQADNSIDWVVADLACQVAGVICLPLPPFFTDAQRLHCLRDSGADLLLSDTAAAVQMLQDAASGAAPVDRSASLHAHMAGHLPVCGGLFAWQLPVSATALARPVGTAKITFTSGSTGTPKGVCLSAAHLWQVAQSLADVIGVDAPRHLCLLPLATLLENSAGVYTPLLCGGTVLLPGAAERGLSGSSGLDTAALLDTISRHQPTTLILLPQLLSALVSACAQGWQAPASLRFIAVGGARVAPALLQAARACGLPVYEGYGLSECGSVVALNTPAADRPGTVGQLLPHVQVQINAAEVVVSGACFLGYLGQPDSWYPTQVATGDLGCCRDGWLQIDGRRKNLLISAFGRNISPEWVESALLARPLLSQCVVLGDARPYLVALLSAPDAVTDGAIDSWVTAVNATLPDYARIGRWQRLPAPAWTGLLTANGRPQRALLETRLHPEIAALYAGA